MLTCVKIKKRLFCKGEPWLSLAHHQIKTKTSVLVTWLSSDKYNLPPSCTALTQYVCHLSPCLSLTCLLRDTFYGAQAKHHY